MTYFGFHLLDAQRFNAPWNAPACLALRRALSARRSLAPVWVAAPHAHAQRVAPNGIPEDPFPASRGQHMASVRREVSCRFLHTTIYILICALGSSNLRYTSRQAAAQEAYNSEDDLEPAAPDMRHGIRPAEAKVESLKIPYGRNLLS